MIVWNITPYRGTGTWYRTRVRYAVDFLII